MSTSAAVSSTRVPTIAQLTSPLVTFQPQGRDTRTYQFSDNASLMAGNHALQFGGSLQRIRVNPYNFGGRLPQRQLRLHWRTAPLSNRANFPASAGPT